MKRESKRGGRGEYEGKEGGEWGERRKGRVGGGVYEGRRGSELRVGGESRRGRKR